MLLTDEDAKAPLTCSQTQFAPDMPLSFSIARPLVTPKPWGARNEALGDFEAVNHVTFGDLRTELRKLWMSPPTASSSSPRREKS